MEPTMWMVVLTLVMPPHVRDVVGKIQVDNEKTCIEMVDQWLAKGLTRAERDLGAIAIAGGCMTNEHAVET